MSRIDWPLVLERAKEIVLEYTTAVTLRQLHYRLVSAPNLGYPNTESAYKRLSELTAKARRRDDFPALTDLTRSIVAPLAYDGPGEALSQLADSCCRDRCEGQDVIPVIVAEKETLVTQLDAWFGAVLGVPIIALRGYSSESYEREIRGYLEPPLVAGRSYAALYLGDFDPSGVDIERNARRYLDDLFASWTRVAITDAQIDDNALPENPGKTSDSRARAFSEEHGRLVQVEVEALDPHTLRALLQREIDVYWDYSKSEAVRERERQERELLRRLATGQP